MAIISWIWDVYERKVFVLDESIEPKARRIQILLHQQVSEETQIDM